MHSNLTHGRMSLMPGTVRWYTTRILMDPLMGKVLATTPRYFIDPQGLIVVGQLHVEDGANTDFQCLLSKDKDFFVVILCLVC